MVVGNDGCHSSGLNAIGYVLINTNSKILAKSKGCDPRFEALSGQFNQDMFYKAYSFVHDKRQDEIKSAPLRPPSSPLLPP